MKLHRISKYLALAGLLSIGMAMFASSPSKHRVLFTVSSPDPADWQMVMHNAHNLIQGLQPESVDVEVLAFGSGIGILKSNSPVRSDIESLQKADVHFVACANSMRAAHLTITDLLQNVAVVPSGIVEIVRKQEQGWSYIKGGR
jgi:intracellular sulfur oxidation DsrE/DsrF family protein